MAVLRRFLRLGDLSLGAAAIGVSLDERAPAAVHAALGRPGHTDLLRGALRLHYRGHQISSGSSSSDISSGSGSSSSDISSGSGSGSSDISSGRGSGSSDISSGRGSGSGSSSSGDSGAAVVRRALVRACAATATTMLAMEGATPTATEGATPPATSTVRQAWHRPDVAVVLVHPQIPGNSGSVARTCAATAAPLHLVGPLGFQLDDRKLKRAGLDYWDAVIMNTHASWTAFFAFFRRLPGPKRLVAFTVYGKTYYGGPAFAYQPGDWLVFGAETSGLPPEAHDDVVASGGCLVKIPIRDMHVRSINLAVAVGVGLFEAIRQLDETEGNLVAARQSPTLQEVAAAYRDGKPLGPKAGSML